jgi:hypothetical protein
MNQIWASMSPAGRNKLPFGQGLDTKSIRVRCDNNSAPSKLRKTLNPILLTPTSEAVNSLLESWTD